jgi:UTP:GlnB (protein PII) uridylyltransferase
MPERYREEFAGSIIRQHARIAAARGRRPIHVDRFIGSTPDGSGLCIIAPDAPGLLSIISVGLMLEGFNISRADAFTRRTPGEHYEAVDLFWVQRSRTEPVAPPTDVEVAAIRVTLRDLLSNGNARQRLRWSLSGTSAGSSETSVRFKDRRGVPWLTLELESNDRPGLLAIVTATLAAEGLQIVDSRIRTHGLRVHDYFDVIEANGSRIKGTRLQRIQLAVLTAIDGEGYASGPSSPFRTR